MIMIPESEMVDALVLPCCGLTVADFYNYCPQCGKKIDRENAKRKRYPIQQLTYLTMPHGFARVGKGTKGSVMIFAQYAGKTEKHEYNVKRKL